jgi:putative transposase
MKLVLDRDWNAAINILNLALSTTGHVGTWVDDFGVSAQSNAERSRSIDPNASGDLASTEIGESLFQQAESMNEESPHF